jgi:hypothetical protein
MSYSFMHAYDYAKDTAGANAAVSRSYARHYVALIYDEEHAEFWPPHSKVFWEWIKWQPITDWRE